MLVVALPQRENYRHGLKMSEAGLSWVRTMALCSMLSAQFNYMPTQPATEMLVTSC